MTHPITGVSGAATFGGNFNALLTRWEANIEGDSAEAKYAGAGWVVRTPTHSDWEATVEGFIPDSVNRYVFTSGESGFATTGALALKFRSSDSTPHFASTGLFDRIRWGLDSNDNVTFTARVRCSEGTAPTIGS